MEPLLSANPAEVVVVGGGPIGLATAIQVKKLTDKNVAVIEKYDTYRRTGITLRIDKASLKGLGEVIPEFQPKIDEWAAKPVPIAEIESALLTKAHDLGIQVLRPKTANYTNLATEFPQAKVFVGADGARSMTRREAFQDRLWFEKTHQHIINIRYRIRPNADEKKPSFFTGYLRLRLSQYYINESRRKGTDDKGDYADVSLQVFVDEATYSHMSNATFGNPYYFDTDLDKIPDNLKTALIAYWGDQNADIIQNPERKNQISVIKLGSYVADQLYKENVGSDGRRTYTVLVGDAAAAFPFFRAINNGFLSSTKLAKSIEEGFKKDNFENPLKWYQFYVHFRAVVELIKATCKSIFITLAKLWLSQSHDSPAYRLKVSYDYEVQQKNRGERIWSSLNTHSAPLLVPAD